MRSRRWARVASRVVVVFLAWTTIVTAGSTAEVVEAQAASSASPPARPPYRCLDGTGLLVASWYPCDDGVRPPDLLNRTQLMSPPGALSNSLASATEEQRAALKVLEEQAIADVLEMHGLPASDAEAVKSWARNDAIAQLWLLLANAIQTPEDERTVVQRHAVDWLEAVYHRHSIAAAEAAAYEYLDWAGLDPALLRAVLAQGSPPAADKLTEAMEGLPVPWGNGAPDVATTGYCAYQPPDGFESQYSGGSDQTCFRPCTNPLGCTPPYPDFDQLEQWGAARYNNELFGNVGFAAVARAVDMRLVGLGIAAGSTLAVSAAVVAAMTATGVGLAAIAQTLAPFTFGASAVADFGAGTAVAAAGGVGFAAAAILFVVAVVIVAIVISVLQGIAVFDGDALPAKLADLIVGAHSSVPDLESALDDPDDAVTLFSLFLATTLPDPSLAECDNGSQVAPVAVIPPLCLNMTPIPAAGPADLLFEVTPEGSSTPTMTPTISYRHVVGETTTTTRMAGRWFVHHSTDRNGVSIDLQSLRINYTGWDDAMHTAWLLGNATDGYRFVDLAEPAEGEEPVDPKTCLDAPESDDRCAPVDSIKLATPAGDRIAVRVVPPPQPPPPPPPVPDTEPPVFSWRNVEFVVAGWMTALHPLVEFSEPVVGPVRFRVVHDGVEVGVFDAEGGWSPLGGAGAATLFGLPFITFELGHYEVTVLTDGVTDVAGNPVAPGGVRTVSLQGVEPLTASIDPIPSGNAAPTTATIRFNRPAAVSAANFWLQHAKWPHARPMSADVTLTPVGTDGPLAEAWTLSGLDSVMRDPTTGVVADGRYRFFLSDRAPAIVDVTGEEWFRFAQAEFEIDTTPDPAPSELALSPPVPDGEDGWYHTPVSVAVVAPEGAIETRCVVIADEEPVEPPTAWDQLPAEPCTGPYSDGTYTVYAAASDGLADPSPVVAVGTFRVDTPDPPPTITLSPGEPDGSAGWYRTPVMVAVTPAGENLETRCVADPVWPYPDSWFDLPVGRQECAGEYGDGTHRLFAASSDGIGGPSPVSEVTFRVDTTAPTFDLGVDPATPDGANGWWTDTVGFSASWLGAAGVRCVVDPAEAPASYAELAALPPSPFGCGRVFDRDGVYEVYGAAIDAAGNTSPVEHATLMLDRSPPATTITLDPVETAGIVTSVGVDVAAADNLSGVAAVRCVLDPQTAPTGFADLPDDPCDIGVVDSDGIHTVYAAALDQAGHHSVLTQHRFTIDTAAPVVSITLDPQTADGDNGWYATPVGVDVKTDDPHATVRCVLDPDTVPASFADLPEGFCDLGTVTTEGTHVAYAAALDPFGNVSEVVQHEFRIDRTAPIASITLDPAQPDGPRGWYRTPVDVTVTANDDNATIRCVLDPSAEPTNYADLPEGPCDLGTVDADGTHVVYAAARDDAGNTELVDVEFQIDQTAPSVSITLNPGRPDGLQGWYVAPVNVSIATDNDATLRCVINPATVPSSFADLPDRACQPFTVRRYGHHTVYAAAVDAAGNTSPIVRRGFKHVGHYRCHGQPATHVGTAGNDTIAGTAGDDVIVALGGHDTIRGRGGNDHICAGAGNDRIRGGPGHDRIHAGVGHDVVYGGEGRDTIAGGAGRDRLRGGSGNDTIAGEAGRDWILGADGDDRLHGGPGPDLISGGPGDDRLVGGTGHDVILGGAGNDWLHGGAGNDLLAGGPGVDAIRGGPGRDRTPITLTGRR